MVWRHQQVGKRTSLQATRDSLRPGTKNAPLPVLRGMCVTEARLLHLPGPSFRGQALLIWSRGVPSLPHDHPFHPQSLLFAIDFIVFPMPITWVNVYFFLIYNWRRKDTERRIDMIQVNDHKFKFQREFQQSWCLWRVLRRLLQIILIFLFYFSESGGGKKGGKKKGSSFQTVSALFRVQYFLKF